MCVGQWGWGGENRAGDGKRCLQGAHQELLEAEDLVGTHVGRLDEHIPVPQPKRVVRTLIAVWTLALVSMEFEGLNTHVTEASVHRLYLHAGSSSLRCRMSHSFSEPH